MSDRFDYLNERLDQLRRAGRLRHLVARQPQGAELVEPGGRRLINFGGNDYLGLATEHSSEDSFTGTLSPAKPREKGQPVASGSGASALVCGWTAAHERLARQIATLESTEAAVVFPSGFAACSGAVATLAEAGDLVLSDELNHASLIDGCRLSRAERVIYPHRDVEFVARVLRERRERFARVWIVTDGVFSMDGHIAPLGPLCDVAEAYDATMVVDEAHGTGVLGTSGSGVCEALGVKPRVPIRIGTLSKAIGTQGGFVAGPSSVIDYLINRCRPLIYSTALAPAAVEAAGRAIESFRTQPQRRQRVKQLATTLRELLSLPAGPVESTVPIVPVVIGDDSQAVQASRQLAAEGFFVPAIRPPTVPEGTARLRISLSAAHSDASLESLAAALHRCR